MALATPFLLRIFSSGKYLGMFLISPRSIFASTQAAASKFAIEDKSHEDIYDRISYVKSTTDAWVCRFPGWENLCGFTRLREVLDSIRNDPLAGKYSVNCNEDGCFHPKEFSKTLYRFFLDSWHSHDTCKYFAERLAKFCDDVDIARDFPRVELILRVITPLPPCIRYAVLSLWSNVWNTAGRFQAEAPCVFCDLPDNRCHIKHDCVCIHVWKFMHDRLYIKLPKSAYNFVLPFFACDSDIIKWACTMYALSRCISNKSNCPLPNKDWGTVREVVWGHCKIAALYCPKLRVVLRNCHPNSRVP